MWFLHVFGVGFAFTLGMEVALALCISLKYAVRSKKQ
jgi:hypothetical protein